MKKMDLIRGLRFALWMLFYMLLVAIASYAFGCWSFNSKICGVAHGIRWIFHHPVFPKFIFLAPVFSLLIGTFGGVFVAKNPAGKEPIWVRIVAVILAITLIAAFAWWGMPELIALREFRNAQP